MNFIKLARESALHGAVVKVAEVDFDERGPIPLKVQVREVASDSFVDGALWGYLQAIAELRGELAMHSSTAHGGDRGLAPMFWALWLEKRAEIE